MIRHRIPMYKIAMIRDGSVCADRTVVASSRDLSPLLGEYFKGTVFLAGSRISAGMVVGQDEGRRMTDDRSLERLAGMHNGHGLAPDADGMKPDDLVLRIQEDGQHFLPIMLLKVLVQKGGEITRTRHNRSISADATSTNHRDLVHRDAVAGHRSAPATLTA